MEVATLIIAIVALMISMLAYKRTGGIHDLRRQLDEIGTKSEQAAKGARETAADALNRFENFIRGQEKKNSEPAGPTSPNLREEEK